MTKTTKLKTMLLTLLMAVGVQTCLANTRYEAMFYPNGGTNKSGGNFGIGSTPNGYGQYGYIDSNGVGHLSLFMDCSWYCDMSSNIPTRTGYSFAGWFDATTGGNQAYYANGIYYDGVYFTWNDNYWYAGNPTFYAHWTANTYKLYFDANGGTLTATGNFSHTTSGVTDNGANGYVQVTYDNGNYYIMDGNPTRTGYTFEGWFYGGTQIYKADGNCTNQVYWSNNNWSYPGNGYVTAHWAANTYTVSFNTDGGSDCNDQTVTYDATYGTLPTPTKAGYTFTGWYNGDTKVENTTTYKTAGNSTLTAKWTPNATIGGTAIEPGSDVTLEDGKDLVIAADATVTVNSISYSRQIENGHDWGTICLPFAVTSDSKIQYYTLKNVAEGVMTFEKATGVEANTPAVFKRLSGDLSVSANNVELISGLNGVNDTEIGWTLVGTFENKTIDDENDYYIAKNQFWCVYQAEGKSVTVPAYRAYFKKDSENVSGDAKASSFSIAIYDGDSTTAIGTIDAKGDIQITEGKYMQNGKVVIVKNGKKYNTAGQNIK